jgi:hypothetical protein
MRGFFTGMNFTSNANVTLLTHRVNPGRKTMIEHVLSL